MFCVWICIWICAHMLTPGSLTEGPPENPEVGLLPMVLGKRLGY